MMMMMIIIIIIMVTSLPTVTKKRGMVDYVLVPLIRKAG
jgi:Na+/H+ antiporter NhaC